MGLIPQPPPCPPHLEDEALLIETSGEMPEVALAESLGHLGPLPQEELDCLRAAAARAYLGLLARDLDPASPGRPHFRGLERALANLRRLKVFLSRLGWRLDQAAYDQLGQSLSGFVRAEAQAVAAGRPYASCSPGQVLELARELGMDSSGLASWLKVLTGVPAVDHLGLAALARLGAASGSLRRRQQGNRLVLEVLRSDGEVAAATTLPWGGPAELAEQNQARVELVCALLSGRRPCPSPDGGAAGP